MKMVEAAAEATTILTHKYHLPTDLGPHLSLERRTSRRACAYATHSRIRSLRCCAGRRSRTRACRRWALDAVIDYLAPVDIPPVKGQTKDGKPNARNRDRGGRSPGARVQTRSDRPLYCRHSRFPRVFGRPEFRATHVLLPSCAAAGAHRADPAAGRCTPTNATRSRKVRSGDIAAAVGLKYVTTG